MASYSIRDVKITHLLDRAEKDMMDLKSKQYVGKHVLQTKNSISDVLYKSDDGISPDHSTTFKFIYKTVTFKADNQTSPYGRLMMDIYKSDQVTPITNSDNIKILYVYPVVTQVDDGLLKWQVNIQGPNSVTSDFYIRFSVAATDSGVVTADNTVII
jgi:hypothetical protein